MIETHPQRMNFVKGGKTNETKEYEEGCDSVDGDGNDGDIVYRSSTRKCLWGGKGDGCGRDRCSSQSSGLPPLRQQRGETYECSVESLVSYRKTEEL